MAKNKKMPMTSSPSFERRVVTPLDDKTLYRHKNLPQLAQHERRKDMLSRLREVQDQRLLWLFVVSICMGMNALLVGLGLWGWLHS